MDELVYFEELSKYICNEFPDTAPGKMMRSPALTSRGKVFCFISRENKMVFKLGNRSGEEIGYGMKEFNPFKNKGPLKGWWEVPYTRKELWKKFAVQAYHNVKKN